MSDETLKRIKLLMFGELQIECKSLFGNHNDKKRNGVIDIIALY